jgi:putative spermidine/putrescine transport system permease protein
MQIYLVAAIAFLAVPLAVVVVVGFTSSNFVAFPPESYSTKWIEQVLSDSTFMMPLWNSLVLGFAASIVAAVLAIPAAIALVRFPFPGATELQAFFLSPLSIPPLVLSIGMLFFFSGIGLGNTVTGLLIGHVVVVLPYLVRTVVAVYLDMDRTVEDAAITLGASPLRTFLLITLPLLRPGLFAGGLFAFLISFDEVAIALLLSTASSVTLPVAIFSYLIYSYDPAVAAISVVQMVLVLILLLILERSFGLGRLVMTGGGRK